MCNVHTKKITHFTTEMLTVHRNRTIYGVQSADMQENHKQVTLFCANFLCYFLYKLGNQCVKQENKFFHILI